MQYQPSTSACAVRSGRLEVSVEEAIAFHQNLPDRIVAEDHARLGGDTNFVARKHVARGSERYRTGRLLRNWNDSMRGAKLGTIRPDSSGPIGSVEIRLRHRENVLRHGIGRLQGGGFQSVPEKAL